MVLAIHSRLRDREDIVEKELAEVGQLVPFPVVDALLQRFDGCLILCLTLSLIDPIGDTLGG